MRSSILGRDKAARAHSGAPWKKVLAMAIVAIMVVSAFAMLVPLAKKPASAPGGDMPARTQAGVREVNYTISNIGESYLKDSRDVDGARGLHGSTPGLSEWWHNPRKINYSDTIAHDSYPYSVAYQPESANNNYKFIEHLPYGTYGFYRFAFQAKNLTTVATGPGKDPLYIPLLNNSGGLGADGGTVKLKWHLTYLTTDDKDRMIAGTHYANSYYGVVGSVLAPMDSAQYPNDGWYVELTGTTEFDRLGAAKFLNLSDPSDSLIDQFNAANTPLTPGAQGPMNQSWWENWLVDGRDATPPKTPAGPYNIFACYDYDINSGPSRNTFLKVDLDLSTPSKLVLRSWACIWGIEYLMLRYLDVQGLMHNFIPSVEDWYFNATITTTGADIESRMQVVYHMTTWKDTNWWGPAYMLEASHVDYNDLGGGWASRFFDYMAIDSSGPTRQQYEPGSNNFGVEAAYVCTPTLWNLGDREKLVIKLPTGPHMGYIPYKGTVSDVFPKQGGGNDAKVAEMNTHKMWGELVLSPRTFPSALYNTSYYNPATKTLTILGPTSWPGNMNPHAGFTTLYETGSPNFIFDVVPVSDYVMTLPAGPYETGKTYTLTVTAKNVTGATVSNANGTVNLTASAGVTLGAISHKWSVSNNGVWTTTVMFTSSGLKSIRAVDMNFSLDVDSTLSVPAGFVCALTPGWNFVSVPFVGYGLKASTLGLLPGDMVSRWNTTTQRYDLNHIVGSGRNDFAIEANAGYWVYAGSAETIYLGGVLPTTAQSAAITVPTGGGWVIIGFESLSTARVAEDVGAMYTGGSVLSVSKYAGGPYITHVIPSTRNNFQLGPGVAYWIWVTASGTLSYSP